jgi:hypothetical protein
VINSSSGRRQSMDEKLNFSKLFQNKALHIYLRLTEFLAK